MEVVDRKLGISSDDTPVSSDYQGVSKAFISCEE